MIFQMRSSAPLRVGLTSSGLPCAFFTRTGCCPFGTLQCSKAHASPQHSRFLLLKVSTTTASANAQLSICLSEIVQTLACAFFIQISTCTLYRHRMRAAPVVARITDAKPSLTFTRTWQANCKDSARWCGSRYARLKTAITQRVEPSVSSLLCCVAARFF